MKKTIQLFILSLLIFQQAYSQKLIKHSITFNNAQSSESYKSMTFNGAWTWFNDPRAVYFEGKHKRTYSGWVDNYGDIHVAFYDHETKEIESTVVSDNLEINDHNSPSILIDEEGYLLIFFHAHVIGNQPLFLIKSREPENINSWSEVKKLYSNDEALKEMGGMNHTYTHPIKLSAEKGRIYLFWQGVDGKPSFSHSDDNGETWATGKIYFMPGHVNSFRRPYTKIYSDGIDKIHITLTDGHPRDENDNNIYYMYFKNGAFYTSDGRKIRSVENLPVLPSEVDLVYGAKKGKANAWIWDIAADNEGNPIIAYAKFPDDKNHIYCYANWNNNKWNNHDLINSGGWFPETRDGMEEPEPYFSGGMSIDKESPNTMYLSVKRDSLFEIEKWETKNKGNIWNVEEITNGSSKNNVRPAAVRGAKEKNPIQVLWMQNSRYWHFANTKKLQEMGGGFDDRFQTAIKMNLLSPEIENPLNPESIVHIMHQTADWQLANPLREKHPRASVLNWMYGTFYFGLRALYELTEENRYKDELINIGQANNWKPMDDILNADRLAVFNTWAWLYKHKKDPQMIDKAKWTMDIYLARNYKHADVRFQDNPLFDEWWSWCDALFMAPPTFVEMWSVVGNEEYLKYMDTQWWHTSDYLYSKEDSLFYRDDRYIEKRTANNKKIFWSRGNGWVIAGLTRILETLPKDYSNQNMFETQYKEIASKLLALQSDDGLWRVSLLDPEYLDIGESSGSGFFTYALAWGINNGLIDKKYQPQVEKAWVALCNNVNNEGRLGFVQQVAGDPYPFYENQWNVYATGAFLMAGKEMHQLLNTKKVNY